MPQITQQEVTLAIVLGQEVVKLLNGSSTAAETQKRLSDGIAQGNAWLAAHGQAPIIAPEGGQ